MGERLEILQLIKFGEIDHLTSLREKGHIFMNFNKYFRKDDLNKERYDPREGAIRHDNISNQFIEIRESGSNEWKRLNATRAYLDIFGDTSAIYSYSLSAITEKDLDQNNIYRFDSKLKGLGSHFMLICNPRDFLNRINEYLVNNEFDFNSGAVRYYPKGETHENLTLYDKPDTLMHQREYRIIVHSKSNEPLQFEIGNICEYCSEIFETEKLDNYSFRISMIPL